MSNGTWVPGTLLLRRKTAGVVRPHNFTQTPKGIGLASITYNVKLPKVDKPREDVPIDAIRPRFCQAELVDVFSKRDHGTWLPGCIIGHPPQWASTLGYRVMIECEGIILEKVPPLRLRRRFPPGCGVEVYRGSSHGWVPAVVHSLAGAAAAAGHEKA